MTPSEAASGDVVARRLHPLTLVFSTLRIGRGLLVPALIGGFSAGGDASGVIGWTLGLLAVPALGAAVVRYHRYRFRLTGEELVIDSGALSRRKRVIPLERVQNIDLRQSALERVSGVAELRIETAGGGETEAVLSVLAVADARALQEELLAWRRLGVGRPSGSREAGVVLARLSPRELVVAGATANEIGLIAAALAGAAEFADEILVRLPDLRIDPEALAPELGPAAAVVAVVGLLAVLLLIGWVVSIGAAVVGYWGFTLEQADGELRKRYGVLGRDESVVPLERVQAVRIEESLLRRPLGLAAVKIETAGGAPGGEERGGAEAFVPIARAAELPRLVAALFPELELASVELRGVHPLARRRIFVRWSAPLVVAAAALALRVSPLGLLLLALLPGAWLLAGRAWRARGWALSSGYVITRDGFLNRRTWIVPERKLQTLHVTASPLQRRRNLATLLVDTAAGARTTPRVRDLAAADAAGLLHRLARRAAATA